MATHSFSFAGGDILAGMGAAWFVSYTYYERIDCSHKNWSKVSTASVRISKYKRSEQYHKLWLQEVLVMNPLNLKKNTIGLEADCIKKMAHELLELENGEKHINLCNEGRNRKNETNMTTKEKLKACKSQLIFEDFLDRYALLLSSLRKNQGFISELKSARGDISPEVEFCTDKSNPALVRFKNHINECLHDAKVYYDYIDLKMIVDDVQKRGIEFRGKEYTKMSAYISVYYALRYLKLSEK